MDDEKPVRSPDLAIAEKRYRDRLEDCSNRLGGDHPDTIIAINMLALLLFRSRKLDEAEHLYRRALLADTRRLGEDHPDALSSLNNLAVRSKSQTLHLPYRYPLPLLPLTPACVPAPIHHFRLFSRSKINSMRPNSYIVVH
jgi:hypothetical protein